MASNGGRQCSYTDLTGKPELPPLWALGHQCKWSYYPESNVKEITAKFRELKIPRCHLFGY
jgi:alpha-glucosidase